MSQEHEPNKQSQFGLITPAELQQELGGISRRTLDRWTRAGMLHPVRLNKRVIRYLRSDVQAMLERFTSGKAAS
jgi:predicted site-specific integrase-resolvase